MSKSLPFAALAVALAAAPAAAQTIGGSYKVQGTNFDGSPYGGTAQITVTSDTTCKMSWKTGGTVWNGICMRNGDAFSAAYQSGKAIGLVIYRINPDGSMSGVWTLAGENGAGTETLTPR